MDSKSIVEFLGHLKAKNVHARGKWVQCSCPLAPWNHDTGKDASPSFAVRVEPHKESYFNCFVCHAGKLSELLVTLQHNKAHLQGYDLAAAWKLLDIEDAQKVNLHIKDWGATDDVEPEYVIPDSWLQSFKIAWDVPMAREYLQSRMVTHDIAQEFDIRWDRSRRTVCFPVRNRDGELVSMRGRRVLPEDAAIPYHVYAYMEHQNGQAWLGENTVDYNRPVLMVESVFDATSVARVYKNTVAPMSVGINAARMKRMASCTDVVTLFDQGMGGNKARAIVEHHLKGALIKHLMPTKKDPGCMEKDELCLLLSPFLKILPNVL